MEKYFTYCTHTHTYSNTHSASCLLCAPVGHYILHADQTTLCFFTLIIVTSIMCVWTCSHLAMTGVWTNSVFNCESVIKCEHTFYISCSLSAPFVCFLCCVSSFFICPPPPCDFIIQHTCSSSLAVSKSTHSLTGCNPFTTLPVQYIQYGLCCLKAEWRWL